MRPIKFRAWNVKEKKMYSSYDYWLRLDGEAWSMWDWGYASEAALALGGGWQRKLIASYASDHLMQFTGLEDKKEIPIYEGDILGQHGIGGNNASLVEWHNGGFVFLYKTTQLTLDCIESRQITVIGNMYETPELLEKK